MLNQILISLISLTLIGCFGGSDGGGSGGSGPATSTSNNVGSSPIDEVLTDEELDSLNEDFSKVGRAVDTEDFQSRIADLSSEPIEFDFYKTNVYDVDGVPTNYVSVYKRELGRRVNKLFNVNVLTNYGAEVTHYMGDPSFDQNPGRVKRYIRHGDETLVLTSNPVHIFKLDQKENKVVHLQSASNKSLRSIAHFGNLICGHHLNKEKDLYVFQYKIDANEFSEKVINISESEFANQKIHGNSHCLENTIYTMSSFEGNHNLIKINIAEGTLANANLTRENDRRYHFYKSATVQAIRLQLRKGELRERNIYKYYQPMRGDFFEVSSRPEALKNQFSGIRIYASKASATIDNPKISLIYSEKRKRVLTEDIVKDIEVESYKPQFYKLFKKKDKLYASLQGNSLYEFNYNEDKFTKIGYTNGRRIASINTRGENIYLVSNNGQIFNYDTAKDWSYGSIENIKLRYSDENHNPSLYSNLRELDIDGKKLHNVEYSRKLEEDLLVQGNLKDKQGGALLKYDVENKSLSAFHLLGQNYRYRGNHNNGDDIVHGSRYVGNRNDFTERDSAFIGSLNKDDLSANADKVVMPIPGSRDIYGIRLFGNTYSFISGNKLYSYNTETKQAVSLLRFAGVRSTQTIKTPNDKLLVLNDGQVILLDPVKMTSEVLYVLQDLNIKRVHSLRLFDDKLVFIDQSKSPKIVHLSFSKLNLVDEVE